MKSIDEMATDLTVHQITKRMQRLRLPVQTLPFLEEHCRVILATAERNLEDAVNVKRVARKAWENHESGFEYVDYHEAEAGKFLVDASELQTRFYQVALGAHELMHVVSNYAQTITDDESPTNEEFEAIRTAVSDLIIDDARATAALLVFA